MKSYFFPCKSITLNFSLDLKNSMMIGFKAKVTVSVGLENTWKTSFYSLFKYFAEVF